MQNKAEKSIMYTEMISLRNGSGVKVSKTLQCHTDQD